jgi:nitroreductase
MMDFYDVINNRRSLRRYDGDKMIPEDVLKRIINAGRVAPSASNNQPWRFVVVKNKELLKKIHASYGRNWIKDAPIILVIVGSKREAWKRSFDGKSSLEVDLTIAMDHIILAAEAEGVGSCWIMAYDFHIVREALKLQNDEYISCITPLGYPPEGYQKREMPPKKTFQELVEILE